MSEALCECGHPREPNHLTPGAECSQSGAPDGCGCITFKPKQALFPFLPQNAPALDFSGVGGGDVAWVIRYQITLGVRP